LIEKSNWLIKSPIKGKTGSRALKPLLMTGIFSRTSKLPMSSYNLMIPTCN
jgi:hypothetical protein